MGAGEPGSRVAAVGTAITPCPRTNPCLRRYRTRFLPWMCRHQAAGVKAAIEKLLRSLKDREPVFKDRRQFLPSVPSRAAPSPIVLIVVHGSQRPTCFRRGRTCRRNSRPQESPSVDSAVADHPDASVSPVIVEGYSGGDAPDQNWQSRTRAMLVRQYLQNRFRLVSAALGIVALKGEPPRAVEQSKWDGICIVVLRTKKA